MRRFTCIAFLLFVFISLAAQQRKTLFVIVDGIAADVIEKLPTPNIDAISQEGGFAHAYVGGEKDGYSQTPTISAVGYNTVLTGTWVNKHNVWDNDIAAPNYNYKTIFRLMKEQDQKRTTGVFSSWLDNRTKLVNEDVDFHFDGLEYDSINYPQDEQREFMKRIDEAVTDSAASCIRQNAPDLSWVYLEYTDDMGHMYGDHPKYFSSVENMDRLIGKLWDAINYRRKMFKEEWLIMITTDHGRDSATGKHHGGQSARERSGWISTNARQLNTHFRQNASIADIMPTIARFMNINIEKHDAMEVDGVPLTGPLYATEMKAVKTENIIRVTWKKHTQKGNVKIWIATTNNYCEGRRDEYKAVGSYKIKKESADIDVSNMNSGFYKIVLETPSGYLNRWIGKNPLSRK